MKKTLLFALLAVSFIFILVGITPLSSVLAQSKGVSRLFWVRGHLIERVDQVILRLEKIKVRISNSDINSKNTIKGRIENYQKQLRVKRSDLENAQNRRDLESVAFHLKQIRENFKTDSKSLMKNELITKLENAIEKTASIQNHAKDYFNQNKKKYSDSGKISSLLSLSSQELNLAKDNLKKIDKEDMPQEIVKQLKESYRHLVASRKILQEAISDLKKTN